MDVVVYDKIGKESDRLENLLLATFPQKTITDAPIASFADGADDIPIKQLSVAIEPVQDLHGQDAPYPAGGSVNKLSISGSYTKTSDGYAVPITDIDKIPAGEYVIAISSTNAIAWITTFYNESETAIITVSSDASSAGRQSKAFTLNEDAYKIRIYVNGATTISDIQVEAGSTPTTYKPYSNLCPISGYTSANVTRCGKNLLDTSTVTSGSITYTEDSDGYVTASDTSADARGWGYANAQYKLTLPAGTYKFVWDVKTASTNASRGYRVLNDEGTILANGYTTALDTSGASVAFTLTKATNIGVMIKQFEMVARFMIVLSTDTTDYEPYQGTTYPISFPSSAGTVYGGHVTIEKDGSGTLVVDRAMQDLGALSYTYISEAAQFRSTMVLDNALLPVDSQDDVHAISSLYKVGKYADLAPNDFYLTIVFQGSFASGQVWLKNSNYTDATAFKTAMSGVQLCYELATPITIPLTAEQIGVITSLYGVNNFWADTGNIESLTYRANLGDYINNAITTAVANALNV